MTLQEIRAALHECADEDDAVALKRFFKTGSGEYGEGDVFIGVRVPATRRVAKQYKNLPLEDTLVLLRSEIHEERLLALILMVNAFKKASSVQQQELYEHYLEHTAYINNWDLVDTSAEHIVGGYLWERSRKPLYTLVASESLWERRIAIMATFHFIKKGAFDETLKLAEQLLLDTEDLIHKAVGWMLRELGKRDQEVEEVFLREHYQHMPRTMLRYAIEKFPEELRQQYLKGTINTTKSEEKDIEMTPEQLVEQWFGEYEDGTFDTLEEALETLEELKESIPSKHKDLHKKMKKELI
ncbi:MAG TPA: hypothetical protein DCE42_08830, partial [Myxococcales bacterium]|nr:hypothetical protein [Myxococcales bacterium]